MEYNFFKDELGTIWYRDCIKVEADSYEEALVKVIEMVKDDNYYDNIDYTEPLYDTWDAIEPSDNDNFHTIEIEDVETNKILWQNEKR